MTRIAATLGISLLALAGPFTAAADNPKPIVNLPAEGLNWEVTKEGVGFAALEGDRFKEPYMAMVRLPAGLVSPAHVKTANMFGVVISGTITHIALGASPATEVRLPAGSFYKVPADVGHVSKCVSQVDCVTFLYQDGQFDFLPVDR